MEQWDLFTKDRIRTGTVISKGESVPEGYFRMVVHVSIFNDKNQMLIQKIEKKERLTASTDSSDNFNQSVPFSCNQLLQI